MKPQFSKPQSSEGRRTGRRVASLGVALALVASGVVATKAAAHDLWLQPSDFTPETGQSVSVRILVGHRPASANPLPRRQGWLEEFSAFDSTGQRPIDGVDGTSPAGFISFDEPGLQTLVMTSAGTTHEMSPEAFEAYLEEEGQGDRLLHPTSTMDPATEGSAPRKIREIYYRSVKSLVVVGEPSEKDSLPAANPENAENTDSALGLPLELVLESHPSEALESGIYSIRVLQHGEPIAGLLVEAFALDGSNAEARPEASRDDRPLGQARSDDDGRILLELQERPAAVLLATVSIRKTTADSGADWRSDWTSLTLGR